MIGTRTILAAGAAILLGIASMTTVANARGGHGGGHAGGHAGGHFAGSHHAGGHHHHASGHHRHHHARHERNVVGVGAYGYSSSCAYLYQRWRATGSSYWRNRYYDCAGNW